MAKIKGQQKWWVKTSEKNKQEADEESDIMVQVVKREHLLFIEKILKPIHASSFGANVWYNTVVGTTRV